jgi:hypothetical protein
MRHLNGKINEVVKTKGKHTTATHGVTELLIPILKGIGINVSVTMGQIKAQKVQDLLLNVRIINNQLIETKVGKNNYIQTCMVTLESPDKLKDWLELLWHEIEKSKKSKKQNINSNLERVISEL